MSEHRTPEANSHKAEGDDNDDDDDDDDDYQPDLDQTAGSVTSGDSESSGDDNESDGDDHDDDGASGKRAKTKTAARKAARSNKRQLARAGTRTTTASSARFGGAAEDSGEDGEGAGRGEAEEDDSRSASCAYASSRPDASSHIDDLWASFKQEANMPLTSSATITSTISSTPSLISSLSNSRFSSLSASWASSTLGDAATPTTKTAPVSIAALLANGTSAATQTSPSVSKSPSSSGLAGGTRSPTLSASPLVEKRARAVEDLDSMIDTITKKPRMSTLSKTSSDWQTFKREENIEDDLKNHNKDGFLERQAFLQRTELREWERDRDLRMSKK